MARQNGVHIHFFEIHAAVGNHALRNHFEVADARLGIRSAMRLHQANHYIHILLVQHQVGVVEQVVGFANTRRRANVDAQPGRFLLFFEDNFGHASVPSPIS